MPRLRGEIVDLSAWAGQSVEVSLSVASDFLIPVHGVFVDDVTVSTGQGTTSFEDDGDELDGWTVSGPPAGSPGNANDWIVGTGAETPNYGQLASASMLRQPEFLAFESDVTRVFTFKTGRDAQNRAFPESGSDKPFHPTSHHGNKPESILEYNVIARYRMSMVPYLLQKLSFEAGGAAAGGGSAVMLPAPLTPSSARRS